MTTPATVPSARPADVGSISPMTPSQQGSERAADINSTPPAEDATLLRQAAHYSGLVLAAMLGTLIRLGLEAMARCGWCMYPLIPDDGAVIFPLAWAQGVGCGIMGIAVARKNQLYWW